MAARAQAFTGSAILAAAGQDNEVYGVTAKGFTSVTVYDGQDNTGTVVVHLEGPGNESLNWPVRCVHGIYVEAAGAGSGAVYV